MAASGVKVFKGGDGGLSREGAGAASFLIGFEGGAGLMAVFRGRAGFGFGGVIFAGFFKD